MTDSLLVVPPSVDVTSRTMAPKPSAGREEKWTCDDGSSTNHDKNNVCVPTVKSISWCRGQKPTKELKSY